MEQEVNEGHSFFSVQKGYIYFSSFFLKFINLARLKDSMQKKNAQISARAITKNLPFQSVLPIWHQQKQVRLDHQGSKLKSSSHSIEREEVNKTVLGGTGSNDEQKDAYWRCHEADCSAI
jgi:hypothetical protein